MDPLRLDDLENARAMTAGERGRLALGAMRTGFRLKRAGLRARFPNASPEEVESLFDRWLERDD